MTLPIDPAHLPAVVAQLQQVGVCYYNIGSDIPDGLVDRTKQIMFEHGIPQGSDDPVTQWMGAPPLGPITDPPGRVPPSAWAELAGADCETCYGHHEKMSASGGYWFHGRVIRTTGGQTMTNVVCQDCVDGQRRHTLTTDCPTCSDKSEWCWFDPNLPGDPACSAGRVSVDVVVPGLLPLRDRHPYGPFTDVDGYGITLVDEFVQVWQLDGVTDGSEITVVGADLAPGDYIAIIRKVET